MVTTVDYTWITLGATAIIAIIQAISTAIIANRVKVVETRTMEGNDLTVKAIDQATQAKDQSAATAKAVDGKMEQLLEIATGKATAEATLVEKQAEAERRNLAASGPERRSAQDEVTALDRLETAKVEAHKVLALAAETAKKLIDDATRITYKGPIE